MSSVTIFHNPRCGTSRNTLELIRARGLQPTVIEYLKTPPTRDQLLQLVADPGLGARGVLRAKEPLCQELGLDRPSCTDAELIDAMLAHPVLINRPLVVTPLGTRLCRPAERVLDILP